MRPLAWGLGSLSLLLWAGLSWAEAPKQITYSAGHPLTGAMNYKLLSNPGQAHSQRLKVGNDNDFPLDFRIYPVPGHTGPNGQIGSPLFGEPVEGTGTWLSPSLSSLHLEGHSSQELDFGVQVPSQLAPGDYLGYVMVEPVVPAASETVSNIGSDDKKANFSVRVSSRFAMGVVVRVPGALETKGELGQVGKGVTERGQLFFSLGLKNLGNTYFKPTGKWTLSGPDGSVVRRADRHIWGLMLPGSDCQFQFPLTDPKKPHLRPIARGVYKLQVEVLCQGDTDFKPLLPAPSLSQSYELSLP